MAQPIRHGARLPTTSDDPLVVLTALIRELGDQPATAQQDAVLCLLEAAKQLLPAVSMGKDMTQKDIDDIRASVRAASLSVRGYLARIGNGDPAR
ncbi:MAG: hypothetical protein ABW224_07090 [Kibdelosporangium sp.]